MSNAGKVTCVTMAQFIEVCAGFVREGVLFDADANTLTITLTGGF